MCLRANENVLADTYDGSIKKVWGKYHFLSDPITTHL